MAQLSNDCFATGGQMRRLNDALHELLPRLTPVVSQERVSLIEARQRILAVNLMATMSVPRQDNSAVDGYAVRFDDLISDKETRLQVIGRAAAGHPYRETLLPGNAVRIFTGAPMPLGADTVMMQEDCRLSGGTVSILPGIKRGANRRLAGEDIVAGACALKAGRRLTPQDIGLAAALGQVELQVFMPLKIALLSTGDEIGEPGTALEEGKIYDSNRFMLRALLEGFGCQVTDFGILPDKAEVLTQTIQMAARTHDAVVSSGGVSTGEEDHVKSVMERLGEVYFWRLAIKPGRPIALGQIMGKPYFGLPGNPVAAMVTLLRFARPILLTLAGATIEGPLGFSVLSDFSYTKKQERREWVRVSISQTQEGQYKAVKFTPDGAGILRSLTTTNGLVELPEEVTKVNPGDQVTFFPYSSFGL